MLFLALIIQSSTVMRSEQTQKFKVKLHVLKQTPTGMQVHRIVPCYYGLGNKVRRSMYLVFTWGQCLCACAGIRMVEYGCSRMVS